MKRPYMASRSSRRDDQNEQFVTRNAGTRTVDVPLAVDVRPGPNEFTVFFDNTDTAALPKELPPKLSIHRNRIPTANDILTGTNDRQEITIDLADSFDVDGDRIAATVVTAPAFGQLLQLDGTPIATFPALVTDPGNRVRFVPQLDIPNTAFTYRVGDILAGSSGIFESSGNAQVNISISNTPPIAPAIPDLVAAFDTGLVVDSRQPSTDNLTKGVAGQLQFEVRGVEPGAMVQILRDGVPVGTPLPDPDNDGVVMVTVPAGSTTGVIDFAARLIDALNSVGPSSAALPVAIDLTPPVQSNATIAPRADSDLPVPILAERAVNIALNVSEQVFSQSTNRFAVRVFDKAIPGTTLGTTAPHDAGPNIATSISADLSLLGSVAGDRTLVIEVTDGAGNVSRSDFPVFLLAPGDATYDAPGTPVFTLRYFSARNSWSLRWKAKRSSASIARFQVNARLAYRESPFK